MSEQESHPHRAVDHFVFLISCGFLVPLFLEALLRSSGSTEEETAFTIFAPFAAVLVLVALVLLTEFVERRVAGSRPAWPAALVGIPVACIAAGVAFAAVYPGHHWWWNGLAGAAWGIVVAAWGCRRWRQREELGVGKTVS